MNANGGKNLDACPSYSPDLMALGDCRHCGHTQERHVKTLTEDMPDDWWPDAVEISMMDGNKITSYRISKKTLESAQFDAIQDATKLLRTALWHEKDTPKGVAAGGAT